LHTLPNIAVVAAAEDCSIVLSLDFVITAAPDCLTLTAARLLHINHNLLFLLSYISRDCLVDQFQLRYLQTLNSIAAEHNSTIIFPMPINLATKLFGGRGKREREEEEEERGLLMAADDI
jgi:hypothetical protein